ncbi:MAG: hypothetical protein B7Z43_07785 [Sphingomonas sp. 12-62-6]|nr:MAG: hypothetical protein B7Z43_07785 [Sphingomonas sp. 12-62-6]
MISESPLLLDVSRMLWRRWGGRQPTGIDRACLAYGDHFGSRAQAVAQRGGLTRVLRPAPSHRLFEVLSEDSAAFKRKVISGLVRDVTLAPWRRPTYHGALYLNVGHTGLDLAGHARWVRSSGVRAIYYIHDLIPISHPQYCRDGESCRHALRLGTALALAGGIITNSHDSASAIREFADRNGLACPVMLVAPLGMSLPTVRHIGAAPIDGPYFVMVGTLEGRKNIAMILRAWEALAIEMDQATPRLVLIGARGWMAEQVFTALDQNPVLQQYVIELGKCNDAELLTYLSHARALLFPSFVEGQGLPLAEALAVGTPVIASDLAVFRETAGAIPNYVEPNDLAGWIRMVKEFSVPASIARSAQLSRLNGYSPPDWGDHFALVDDWLCRLG